MKASSRFPNRAHLTKGAAAVAVAVLSALSQSAHAQYRIFWTGTLVGNNGTDENNVTNPTPVVDPTHIDDNFANPNNWQNNAVPEANDPTQIEQVGNGSLGDGFSHTPAQATFDADTLARLGIAANGSLTLGDLVVSDASTNQGTFVMNAGELSSNIQLGIAGWVNNSAATGTLLMNGGEINVNAGSMTIGYSNSNTAITGNSHGNVVMMGGSINFNANNLIVGGHTSEGTFDQSGGLVTGTGTLGLGIFGTATNTTAGVGTYLLSGTGQVGVSTLQFGSSQATRVGSNQVDLFQMTGGELSVGTIVCRNPSTAVGTTFSFAGGTLTTNTMAMTLNQQAGTLSPGMGAGVIGAGASVGSMVLIDVQTVASTDLNLPQSPTAGEANYTQAAGAHLLIDLQSGNSDPTVSQNDVVHVEDNGNGAYTTSAALNGKIDLRLNSYSPNIGDKFDVLTADSITDNSTIALDHLAPNYVFTKSLISGNVPTGYSGGPTTSGQILEIAFAGHARPGDDTRDATIDSSDFAVLAAHYNQSSNVGWGDGDFNGDGTVNALDFNLLATNYGKGGTNENPIGGAAAEGAAALGSLVPEPTSAAMLLCIAGMGIRRRRSAR